MNSNNDKIWNNYRKLGPGFFPVMLQCIKRHLKFPLLNAVEKIFTCGFMGQVTANEGEECSRSVNAQQRFLNFGFYLFLKYLH